MFASSFASMSHLVAAMTVKWLCSSPPFARLITPTSAERKSFQKRAPNPILEPRLKCWIDRVNRSFQNDPVGVTYWQYAYAIVGVLVDWIRGRRNQIK